MDPLINLELLYESLPGCILHKTGLIAQKKSMPFQDEPIPEDEPVEITGAELVLGIIQLDIEKLESEVKSLKRAEDILNVQTRLGPFRSQAYSSRDEADLQTAWEILTGCVLSSRV